MTTKDPLTLFTPEIRDEIIKTMNLLQETIIVNKISLGASLNALINVSFMMLLKEGISKEYIHKIGQSFSEAMNSIEGHAINVEDGDNESDDGST